MSAGSPQLQVSPAAVNGSAPVLGFVPVLMGAGNGLDTMLIQQQLQVQQLLWMQQQQQLFMQQLQRQQLAVEPVSESESPPSTPETTPKVDVGAASIAALIASTPAESGSPLRVSGHTKVSGLAGAIAKRLRMNNYVAVEAMGADAVSTTTTALALARSFISHVSLQLLVQVESISTPPRKGRAATPAQEHPGLRFVSRAYPGKEDAISFSAIRKVPEGSQVAKVAGSIAKMVRSSSANAVIGLVLGEMSSPLLNTAVKSIALARQMLRGNELDIICKPHFENNDQKANKVQIAVYVVPRQGEGPAPPAFLESSASKRSKLQGRPPCLEHEDNDDDDDDDDERLVLCAATTSSDMTSCSEDVQC